MNVDATYLLQLMLNGLILGLIYALIAVGLSLIFGVLGIVNFAHGELLMAGAYMMAFALPAVGGRYLPALAMVLLASALLGLAFYELLLARLDDRDFDRSILITIGFSMVLLYGCQALFSSTPKLVNTSLGYSGLAVGALRITWTRLAAAALAFGGFAVLWMVLHWTRFGLAMRALAVNRDAALMVGVRPRSVARNAVIVATMLSGLAGAALAPIYLVQPGMGQVLIFKAFALIIIGGLGSLPGAALAGIGLGIVESWIGGFFSAIWQEVAAFVVMIAVLLARPRGILGRRALRAG